MAALLIGHRSGNGSREPACFLSRHRRPGGARSRRLPSQATSNTRRATVLLTDLPWPRLLDAPLPLRLGVLGDRRLEGPRRPSAAWPTEPHGRPRGHRGGSVRARPRAQGSPRLRRQVPRAGTLSAARAPRPLPRPPYAVPGHGGAAGDCGPVGDSWTVATGPRWLAVFDGGVPVSESESGSASASASEEERGNEDGGQCRGGPARRSPPDSCPGPVAWVADYVPRRQEPRMAHLVADPTTSPLLADRDHLRILEYYYATRLESSLPCRTARDPGGCRRCLGLTRKIAVSIMSGSSGAMRRAGSSTASTARRRLSRPPSLRVMTDRGNAPAAPRCAEGGPSSAPSGEHPVGTVFTAGKAAGQPWVTAGGR